MALEDNMESDKKTARLETQVKPIIKERVDFAAGLTGVTPTDLMIASVVAAANKTVEQHRVIRLSRKDAAHFVNSLLKPSGPSLELKAAAARYKKRTG